MPLPALASGPRAYTGLAASNGHVCGIRTDGSIGCWGDDSWGETYPPSGPFTAVTIGEEHACAIRNDGTVACWGEADDAPGGTFAAVSAGAYGTCGLRTSGRLACWGDEESRRLPMGTFTALSGGPGLACAIRTSGRLVCWGEEDFGGVAKSPAGRFSAVSVGATQACAIRTDGTVVCWGEGFWGSFRPDPVLTPPGGRFVAVTVGDASACGIRADHRLACWGRVETDGGRPLVPAGRFVAVSAASSDVCAIRADRALICWGGGFAGRGVAGDVVGVMPDVTRIEADSPIVDVAAGTSLTCVLRADRSVGCWSSSSYLPVPPPPSGTFAAIAVGEEEGCGIRTDGTLACWGNRDSDRGLVPVAAPPDGGFASVTVGNGFACGIRTTGQLVCWGAKWVREVAPSGTFTAVSAGYETVCATRPDGQVECFGEGIDGEPPIADTPFRQIRLSETHACGLREDGTVGCWGSGEALPYAIPEGRFTALGDRCGLRADGTIECWGPGPTDDDGNPLAPVAPPAGTFTALDDGCAVRTDGTLMCWTERGQVLPVPTAYVEPPSSWVATGDVTLRWGGSGLSPIVSYDVDASWLRKSGTNGDERWKTRTPHTSATIVGRPGRSYCVSVLAHDSEGLVSTRTIGDCVVAPLDDTVFRAATPWQRVSARDLYRSTALKSSAKGATLTTRVAPMRLALIAATCPTCGAIKVSGVANRPVRISLKSSAKVDRAVIEINLCDNDEGCPDEPHPTTLTIKVVTSGKPVIIDGVAVG